MQHFKALITAKNKRRKKKNKQKKNAKNFCEYLLLADNTDNFSPIQSRFFLFPFLLFPINFYLYFLKQKKKRYN